MNCRDIDLKNLISVLIFSEIKKENSYLTKFKNSF